MCGRPVGAGFCRLPRRWSLRLICPSWQIVDLFGDPALGDGAMTT
jgi:hypothetical protein